MFLLDSNILSELMNDDPDVGVLTYLALRHDSQIVTSSICIAEVRTGIACLPEGKRQAAISQAFDLVLDRFVDRVIPFAGDDAYAYGLLFAHLKALGATCGKFDVMIAATASMHDAVIVTRNVKHFAQTGLIVENPFAFG